MADLTKNDELSSQKKDDPDREGESSGIVEEVLVQSVVEGVIEGVASVVGNLFES